MATVLFFISWVILIVSIWSLWKIGYAIQNTWHWAWHYHQNKMLKIRNEAETLFVETGTLTQPILDLSRSDLKAVTKRRASVIRARTLANKEFHAMTVCPRCSMVDVHGFDSVLRRHVNRQCNNCHYVWKQT